MGEYRDMENQLKYFWEKEPVQEDGDVVYTLDYFDETIGDLQERECPTAVEFAAAILREILVNMKPNHPLWDKIKHAAFILHLATRSKNFLTYFTFFHEMENETSSKNLTWKHRTIQKRLLDMVIEQVDQLALLSEIKSEDIDGQGGINHTDLNNDVDYYENDIENDKEYNENSNGIGEAFEMSNSVDTDPISEEPKLILSDDNAIIVKPEKNEDESADKENVFDTKVNCSIADNSVNENKDNVIPGEKKYKIKSKKNKIQRKLKRVKKEEYEEESTKEKKTYYVKKEKKSKMFQCSSCDYSSDYHAQIDQHTFKQHSSLCTQCGHQSETFKEYQEHAETHPYSCEICKVKFVGIRTLRRHMTIEHQTENLYTKEKKMVPCHICGKLVGEPSLRGHIKNIHSTEIHKCDFCDFTTNRAMKVRVHMKKHLRPAKPCPECGKHVKSLAQHFRLNCSSTVQKERYPCPICEKTFSKKDGMQKHIRHVHDNVKNILCNFCDYKTNSSFNLRLHVSKMHTKEELEVECQFCNIKTRGLEYHLKIYHFKEYQEIKLTGLIHKVE